MHESFVAVMNLVQQLAEEVLALDEREVIVWASRSLEDRFSGAPLVNNKFKKLFRGGGDDVVVRDHVRYLSKKYVLTLDDVDYTVVTLEEVQNLNTPRSGRYAMEQILNTVEEGIIVSDHEGRIVVYNRALEQQEGLKAAEALGKYIWDVYRYSDYTKSEHRGVFNSGVPIVNKYRAHSYENGVPNYLSYSTYPVVFKDTKVGVFSVCKNETGLQSMLTATVQQKRKFLQTAGGVGKKINQNGTSFTFADIVGSSEVTENLILDAQHIAFMDSSVLIVGETGTGKEVYAQSIHNHGRAAHPFIGLNCAAIPESLFESILFGALKGAYTDAQDTPGLFEKAGEGTIFLDELNSMPPGLQSKLLRALQERSVRRVGGVESIPIRCRFISAINIDPQQLVDGGFLRQDLFYRIAAIRLYVEPLRNRLEDLTDLADFFITRCNEFMGKKIRALSPELFDWVRRYSWPGNIREFEHFIENLMVRSKPGKAALEISDIPSYLKKADEPSDQAASKADQSLTKALDSLERRMIVEALQNNKNNLSATARELGIIRQSLAYRMKRLGVGKT